MIIGVSHIAYIASKVTRIDFCGNRIVKGCLQYRYRSVRHGKARYRGGKFIVGTYCIIPDGSIFSKHCRAGIWVFSIGIITIPNGIGILIDKTDSVHYGSSTVYDIGIGIPERIRHSPAASIIGFVPVTMLLVIRNGQMNNHHGLPGAFPVLLKLYRVILSLYKSFVFRRYICRIPVSNNNGRFIHIGSCRKQVIDVSLLYHIGIRENILLQAGGEGSPV